MKKGISVFKKLYHFYFVLLHILKKDRICKISHIVLSQTVFILELRCQICNPIHHLGSIIAFLDMMVDVPTSTGIFHD